MDRLVMNSQPSGEYISADPPARRPLRTLGWDLLLAEANESAAQTTTLFASSVNASGTRANSIGVGPELPPPFVQTELEPNSEMFHPPLPPLPPPPHYRQGDYTNTYNAQYVNQYPNNEQGYVRQQSYDYPQQWTVSGKQVRDEPSVPPEWTKPNSNHTLQTSQWCSQQYSAHHHFHPHKQQLGSSGQIVVPQESYPGIGSKSRLSSGHGPSGGTLPRALAPPMASASHTQWFPSSSHLPHPQQKQQQQQQQQRPHEYSMEKQEEAPRGAVPMHSLKTPLEDANVNEKDDISFSWTDIMREDSQDIENKFVGSLMGPSGNSTPPKHSSPQKNFSSQKNSSPQKSSVIRPRRRDPSPARPPLVDKQSQLQLAAVTQAVQAAQRRSDELAHRLLMAERELSEALVEGAILRKNLTLYLELSEQPLRDKMNSLQAMREENENLRKRLEC